MKNHLKRIAAPKTWVLDRKERVFTVRPNPGAHRLDMGMPLGLLLRDVLGFATTIGEVRKLLNQKEVLVDGKRRKDHRHIVGLFDVLTLVDIKRSYRVALDTKGRLTLVEIPQKEATTKVCRVVGKSLLKGGKLQVNLHDGKNIITDTAVKVGDSVVLELPSLKIKEVLALGTKMSVFLVGGKHSGALGHVDELKGKEATYLVDDHKVDTLRQYLFVVGKDKPVLTLRV